jgi:hypothetical protein
MYVVNAELTIKSREMGDHTKQTWNTRSVISYHTLIMTNITLGRLGRIKQQTVTVREMKKGNGHHGNYHPSWHKPFSLP